MTVTVVVKLCKSCIAFRSEGETNDSV